MTAPPEKDPSRRMRRFLRGETWILRSALFAVAPSALIALTLLWLGDYRPVVQWTLTAVILLSCLWFPRYVHEHLVFSLRTLANFVSFLREKDYTNRLNKGHPSGALDQLMWEVNALRDDLVQERTGAAEANALLDQVMDKIDVAVFAFDGDLRLRLLNARAETLLKPNHSSPMGMMAGDLGLAACLEGEAPRMMALPFGNPQARWEIRRAAFREDGRPHELLVLSDLSMPLRREELHAWQRLVRVLRHELSNGLTPIRSFSETLLWMLQQEPLPASWQADCREGLDVIHQRANALSRMLSAYKGISGLPAPHKQTLDVSTWITHGLRCETRLPINLMPGPEATLLADRDQLDQLLINLLNNAVDAASETGGSVTCRWEVRDNPASESQPILHVFIEDDGPGLASTTNLFVPFFSTKPEGTGTGLVVCRQIAEAHGGSLSLTNRTDATGCCAHVVLPLRG